MDGVSLAKSLGAGYPVAAVWIRQPYADVFDFSSHGTTFGGSPLAMRVALTVLELIERGNLIDNAAAAGQYLINQLYELKEQFPDVIREVRGKGLMIGIEFYEENKVWIKKFRQAGLLAAPAGTHVVRLLPPLIISKQELDEALVRIRTALNP